MAEKGRSPQLGFNTNIRHKAKLYHLQTEDSGADRPYITTHLFVDGGRIIATKRTDYSEYLAEDNLSEIIRNLMVKQHKAMAIALRDCAFDQPEAGQSKRSEEIQEARLEESLDFNRLERAADARIAESAARKSSKDIEARISTKPEPGTGTYRISNAPKKRVNLQVANQTASGSPVKASALARSPSSVPKVHGEPDKGRRPDVSDRLDAGATDQQALRQRLRKKKPAIKKARQQPLRESIFGSETSKEKSLDDVILSYLSQDSEEGER
ncbi:MAG: hypothetical protein JXA30_00920 [Deltaproteobacteria bacterium]|nr:hypothetical protein [Deltaproteobacteria bacterium]